MRVPSATLAALVASVVLLSAAGSTAAQGNSRIDLPHPIEGSWQVRITPYVCATGTAILPAAFDSMMTFGARGTLVETTANRGFLPGQRSPGHGTWEWDWRPSVEASFLAFVQFDTPTPPPPGAQPYTRGVQRAELAILIRDDDSWEGTLTVVFRNAAGEVVSSGCARTQAARIL